jgi:hypothetical protein
MKFRNKLLFIAGPAVVLGLLTSLSAFAASTVPAATGTVLPKGAETLQPYMISAADLGNENYMKCVRSKMKSPAVQNVVINVSAAQDCHTSQN